jgi:hypothetical protein
MTTNEEDMVNLCNELKIYHFHYISKAPTSKDTVWCLCLIDYLNILDYEKNNCKRGTKRYKTIWSLMDLMIQTIEKYH